MSGSVRLPYSSGLDGLRALAVVAVLLYHAELPWIPVRFRARLTDRAMGTWRSSGGSRSYWLLACVHPLES